jgi:phage replication-related protein YjqB (UPF0714/DUF867 family)
MRPNKYYNHKLNQQVEVGIGSKRSKAKTIYLHIQYIGFTIRSQNKQSALTYLTKNHCQKILLMNIREHYTIQRFLN